MEFNIIALAIPVFFVLIGLEVYASRRVGRAEIYRFNDTINDLSCGITSEVTGLFSKAVVLTVYTGVWSWFAVWDLSESPVLHWALGLVGYDLAYYWWHRFSHEVNVGWATHVVHHQSQEYNLAVALRQSATGFLTSLPFYLPLAVVGVHPLVFGISGAISLLYQFWIHTELIDRLGPLEWVFNTPSHHRVHHAINPQYLDRNHGAILIVWDRLFGTFEPEVEQPVYGTVKPLDSFDPLWAQVWYFKMLFDDTMAATTPGERARVWLSAPGYRPPRLPPYPAAKPVTRTTQVKYDPEVPWGLAVYVAAQFVPVAVGLTTLELVEKSASWVELAVGGAFILWAVWNWGALHERKTRGLISELARLVVTATVGAYWLDKPAMIAGLIVFCGLSALWMAGWTRWLTQR